MVRLSPEIAEAIQLADGGPVAVEVPGSDRAYVLVDSATHEAAMDALRKQQLHDSLLKGFEDIKAGRGRPLDEAMDDIRNRLIEKYGDA